MDEKNNKPVISSMQYRFQTEASVNAESSRNFQKPTGYDYIRIPSVISYIFLRRKKDIKLKTA